MWAKAPMQIAQPRQEAWLSHQPARHITTRARSAQRYRKRSKGRGGPAVKEAKLDELKAELMKPEYQSSYPKLTEIQNEIDALEEEILIDMEAWEELPLLVMGLGSQLRCAVVRRTLR